MEERTIKVSLEKAREWYNSGNPTLKELSLQAFNKEELDIPSIKEIIDYLLFFSGNPVQKNQLKELKNRSENNISAPKLLRVLAAYFNKGWKKEIGNSGYFLTKKEWNGIPVEKLGFDWTIIKHESVNYPITYFERESDCKKAFEILKGLGKLENLYTDF